MIEILEQEIKQLMIEELDVFAQFCDEHQLRYYLIYGTLLGAVRHQGFIPWDDDVDVAMPRPDYERFLELTKDGFTETLAVISMKTDKKYAYPFAKIVHLDTLVIEEALDSRVGVYIDIFPLDGLPSSEKAIQKHYRKMYVLGRFLRVGYQVKITSDKPHNLPFLLIYTLLARLYGKSRILRLIDKTARSIDFDQSEMIGIVVWGYFKAREAMAKTDFIEAEKIKFESLTLKAPVKARQWLTQVYGDYMTPPPLDQQVTHHKNNAFWLKDPH